MGLAPSAGRRELGGGGRAPVAGQLGPTLQLDQWAMDLSLFTHVPQLPGGDVMVAPMVWLAGVAGALDVVGVAGFRRRDIG